MLFFGGKTFSKIQCFIGLFKNLFKLRLKRSKETKTEKPESRKVPSVLTTPSRYLPC